MSGSAPKRTCTVCGRKKNKSDLLRIALNAERCIVLDDHQRLQGRGAYLCPGCLPRLRFTRRIQKAFRDQAKGFAENILHRPSSQQKTDGSP